MVVTGHENAGQKYNLLTVNKYFEAVKKLKSFFFVLVKTLTIQNYIHE
jgi:hypothetical protein